MAMNLTLFYDLWWAFNLIVGTLCVIWAIGGYVKQNQYWNRKSVGLWYSRLVWAVAHCVMSIEGIQRDLRLGYTLIFITVAGLTSFFALLRRGAWGYDPVLVGCPEDSKD